MVLLSFFSFQFSNTASKPTFFVLYLSSPSSITIPVKKKKLLYAYFWPTLYNLVGIAIRYGLDGPETKLRWGRGFPHPSRSTLGPTQSPIQ